VESETWGCACITWDGYIPSMLEASPSYMGGLGRVLLAIGCTDSVLFTAGVTYGGRAIQGCSNLYIDMYERIARFSMG
jgi:hypothetical protein